MTGQALQSGCAPVDDVVALAEIAKTENARKIFGLKDANLALAATNWPVPRFVCVRSDARVQLCGRFQADRLLRAAASRIDPTLAVEHVWLNQRQQVLSTIAAEALRILGPHIGESSLAVRSSAPDEDMVHHTEAGLYETMLWVSPDELHVTQAIACVWSSSGAPVIAAPQPHAIGVLIQEMVEATFGGVASSRNPITSASEAVVDVATGGAAQVTSGPSGVTFHLDMTRDSDSDDTTMLRRVAERVGRLVLEVERWWLKPVNIEWVIDREGTLWLLQVRDLQEVFIDVPKRIEVIELAAPAECLPYAQPGLRKHIAKSLSKHSPSRCLARGVGQRALQPKILLTPPSVGMFELSRAFEEILGDLDGQCDIRDENGELRQLTTPAALRFVEQALTPAAQ
jgi:Pyruvate phosphate dikinase, AMP/ATP-binding domain